MSQRSWFVLAAAAFVAVVTMWGVRESETAGTSRTVATLEFPGERRVPALRPANATPATDERVSPFSTGHPSAMTLAWHAGAALRPLVDARIACARAGDRECQYDIYLAFAACEYNVAPPGITDGEALERWLAVLDRKGYDPDYLTLDKQRFRACFGIGPPLAQEIGTASEWLHRAFGAGHPVALMEAAAEVGRLARLDRATIERVVVPSEPYTDRPQNYTISSAFMPAGARDPETVRQHAIELATTAMVHPTPEVLHAAATFPHSADPRRDSLLVLAAWTTLACEAGYPCGADSIVTRQVCEMTKCRQPIGLLEALMLREGPGFPDRVKDCAQRLSAALARGDRAAALLETCP